MTEGQMSDAELCARVIVLLEQEDPKLAVQFRESLETPTGRLALFTRRAELERLLNQPRSEQEQERL